ncbi:hypothetical protein [Specibacter cremeus]|uniref:hypothetical protein n=1 Tax=Specibacter cremeus TaxID=1629051 RepID=UPI00197BE850|nr:hypothetical protein [Specibacter cremeus]
MTSIVLLTALPFVWFGMIAAISFIETPLKFRAPGMTHALGVGIGRLVFKALNWVEAVLAATLIVAWIADGRDVSGLAGTLLVVPMAALAAQMIVLRPAMGKRTRALSETALQPATAAPAQGNTGTLTHIAYIGAEFVKVVALPVAGILTVIGVAG